MNAQLLLFTPCTLEENLLLADSVVELKEDEFVMLVVQNHGNTAVRLKTGVRLGAVTPVDLVPAVKEDRTDGDGYISREAEVESEGAVRR